MLIETLTQHLVYCVKLRQYLQSLVQSSPQFDFLVCLFLLLLFFLKVEKGISLKIYFGLLRFFKLLSFFGDL